MTEPAGIAACQSGEPTMLNRQVLNYIAMVAAAAIIAGIIVLIPALVSQAGASAPADAALTAPKRFGAECSQKAWPYYEPACTFRAGTDQPVQEVRIITADRLAN